MTKANSIDPFGNRKSPDNAILDVDGLAALLGISPATIPTQRSRAPHKLPPPYLTRPLRWRRETVLLWIQEQENAARTAAQLVWIAHRNPRQYPRR